MKKTTIASTLIVGLLVLPTVTFASWWNPFTWFTTTPPSVPRPVVEAVSLTDLVFNKYCVTSPTINYKNTDYSDVYIKSLGNMDTIDFENTLNNSKVTGAQLPEALYYFGFKLTQKGLVDDSLRMYKCAAENYYDIQAMYRMASLYYSGTDSIQEQLPNAYIGNKIAIDYNQAYYWLVALIYSAKQEKTNFLDTNTQRGWNTIEMLDDIQNTHKITGDMNKIEANAIKFVTKRYPNVSTAQGIVGAHGLGVSLASSTTLTSPKK